MPEARGAGGAVGPCARDQPDERLASRLASPAGIPPSLNFRWKIDGPLRKVRLSSGGVYSAHADFWNSWNQKVPKRLVRNCLNAGRVCTSTIADAPR